MTTMTSDLSTSDSSSDPATTWWEAFSETSEPAEPTVPDGAPWLPPERDPRLGAALLLVVASALVAAFGPLCWMHARAELAAIDLGLATPRGRRWILFARAWGALTTALLLAALAALATLLLH
ncbi:MAG: hypothetical protein ACTHU0_03470 [Kofleriaceae bacterium]